MNGKILLLIQNIRRDMDAIADIYDRLAQHTLTSETEEGQTKQFQGGSNAIDSFQSCFPPASTPASFALLSSTQFLRYGGRFHQRTRFKIPGRHIDRDRLPSPQSV